jgi:hypothetical protein
MEQCDPTTGNHQIDWNAVGDRHSQQDPGGRGNPAVDALEVNPTPTGIERHQLDSVDLVAQGDGRETHLAPESQPPAHHFTDRRVAPQPEIEPTTRLGAATSDARDDSVAFKPTRNFESGNGSGDGCFSELR